MSQIRLYLDEDSMRRSLVFAMRARNVDVLTAAEASMINREDDEHRAAASAFGRSLVTHNSADYCVLHQLRISQGRTHAGIIVAPQQRYSFGAADHAAHHAAGTATARTYDGYWNGCRIPAW